MGLYPVLCMKAGGGNFSFCAVDVLRLGVSYSSVAAWAYVIMGGGDPHADQISPGAIFNYRAFCLSVRRVLYL